MGSNRFWTLCAISSLAVLSGASALSPADIEGLLNGKGMGLAKAAELNHYPGPRHVLEHAEALGLSDAQRRSSQAIYDRMHAEAVRLGPQLIAAEHALDEQFARAQVSESQVDQALGEIARISAQLRAVHLKAHVAQRQVLTPEQIAMYDRLRGNHGHHDPAQMPAH